MIPLDFFTEVSKACADRPFALLPKKDQAYYFSELKTVVSALLTKLQNRNLTHTHGYYLVSEMSRAMEGDSFDEYRFAEALSHLDEIYGEKTKPDVMEKVRNMDSSAEKCRTRADEFYMLEARVTEESKGLSEEEIKKHDIEVLEKTGSFYVWEYTLILEQEMLKRNDEEKRKLLTDGLNVEAGSLPGLKPLMKSFRQELAFHIYDQTLRWQILHIFFDFQAILDTDKLKEIMKGLRIFHINLLTVAMNAGLNTFTGFVYKPYPDRTTIKEIIKDLSA